MSKQTPPALTASAVGPCPTVIQIVGRPGTGSLPRTIAPPDHPSRQGEFELMNVNHSARSGGIIGTSFRFSLTGRYVVCSH